MKTYRLLLILVLLTTLFGFGGAKTGLAQTQTPTWTVSAQDNTGTPQLRVPSGEPMTPEMLMRHLPRLSNGALEIVAAQLGVTQLAGKKLDLLPHTGLDNIVEADGYEGKNPSVAVNPENPSIVAVAFQYNVWCGVMASYDGGDTFHYYDFVFLPLQGGGNSCANPSVRFSPDGAIVYYIYTDIDASFLTSDIVMVRAQGDNPMFLIDSTPIVVLDDFGSFLDRPWGDVAYYDLTGGSDGAIYVTATEFSGTGHCHILFNASTSYGSSWTYGINGIYLKSSIGCSPMVTGARPIGNPSTGWVTACWYNSETDGWLLGTFDIECWSSDNFGNGTNFLFTPVNNRKFELAPYLGPSGTYHEWWMGMFPALAVDNTGLLYIAFAADPNSNPSDVEAGNVYLVRGWPTISTFVWGAPVVVGSGSQAQGFPTVTARCDARTNKCYSYVAYLDHLSSNKFYNIVYRKGSRPFSSASVGSLGFGPKIKISDLSSFSHFSSLGDHIDSSVIDGRRYHVVWPDRSDVYSIFDPDIDVMHDVLVP